MHMRHSRFRLRRLLRSYVWGQEGKLVISSCPHRRQTLIKYDSMRVFVCVCAVVHAEYLARGGGGVL